MTVQPTVPAQASGTGHGVEEITPELIERRQTLIPQDSAQDDLEGEIQSIIEILALGAMWHLVMVALSLSKVTEQQCDSDMGDTQF